MQTILSNTLTLSANKFDQLYFIYLQTLIYYRSNFCCQEHHLYTAKSMWANREAASKFFIAFSAIINFDTVSCEHFSLVLRPFYIRFFKIFNPVIPGLHLVNPGIESLATHLQFQYIHIIGRIVKNVTRNATDWIFSSDQNVFIKSFYPQDKS